MSMVFELPGKFLGMVDYDDFGLQVESPECCGWLHLSGFGRLNARTKTQSGPLKQLDVLMKEGVKPKDCWSKVQDKWVHFPLYGVLNTTQVDSGLGKELEARGFVLNTPWLNPNTNYVCYPYFYQPNNTIIA